MNIYTMQLDRLSFAVLIVLLVWYSLIWYMGKHPQYLTLWKTTVVVLVFVSITAILWYSVLYRTPSDDKTVSFFARYTNEFFREMFMNTFLYFPLGLSLTALIGPWSILVAFALSLGIECWQYFAGTGLAQGTDVICNTLGCAIGAIPWFVNRWIDKRLLRRCGDLGEEKVACEDHSRSDSNDK